MVAEEGLQGNAILGALPDAEFAALVPRLELVDSVIRDRVYDPGQPITDLYFPISSVYSLVGVADGRAVVEVATVGREGMVGLPVFLGQSSSPHAAFCQIPGPAARLPAGQLADVLTHDGALHRLLNRFTQATMVQIAQNVVCNSTHPLAQRAARWLLTTHDRVGRDQFALTHEFLSQMLGARRPTVSQTASVLQAAGLVRYQRGQLTITDRAGLEKTTCSCYAIVRAEFDALTK
ncbi:MAG TPA: Crp/Fnr family transcriptional regulator [Streptosporangiaceae bacterium]|jgi:CRP-like cAMP-binding protein|nr:Crp/Fnr family transcriptional regulator [Streptosporangiaceae bacterium]